MKAQLTQPAAAPNPMSRYGINHSTDHHTVQQIRAELGALSHSAGNNGGRSGAEHCLENQKGVSGKALVIIPPHKEIGKANEPHDIGAKHQPKANEPKHHCAQA